MEREKIHPLTLGRNVEVHREKRETRVNVETITFYVKRVRFININYK